MPNTAAFINHLAPKVVRSLGLSSGRSRNDVPAGGDPRQAPQLVRGSWRAPAAWNDSELLRSAASQEQEKGRDSEEGDAVTREISESTQGGMEIKVDDEVEWKESGSRV